jgi:hypothetical protein
MSFEVTMRSGTGRPAARSLVSASGRVQEVTMVQRPGAIQPASRGPGEKHHALEILHFAALDFTVLGGVIGVGEVFADGGEAGTTVGASNYLFRIKAMLDCPATPDPGHGASGVDQDTVQIEQDCLAFNLRHAREPTAKAAAYRTISPAVRVGKVYRNFPRAS